MNKPTWLDIAEHEIGTKEINGPKSNERIIEYHACTSLKATTDETAWCSAFVNWCMRHAGLKGTNSAAARSWLQWGVELKAPVPGCIVIFKRGAPPSGHVAFYASDVGNDYIKVLGGNQGDQVKYSNYPKQDILGYRWPDEGP
jgi:uncharacterized protein (TIGR02594 family)